MLPAISEKFWNRYTAAHLLNRAGFGGTPYEIQQLEVKGVKKAVDFLLSADNDGDLFPVPSLVIPKERYVYQQRVKVAMTEEEKKAIHREFERIENASLLDLRLWWLNRMRYTSAPLLEKATLFWHGYFATSNEKVNDPYLMWQQNETLRYGALGKFPDLLKAMSRDPAMIHWLDLGSSRKGHPNENFAREIMELFSLGEGHYSEKDVQEAARAFTGYRVIPDTGEFAFRAKEWDGGSKIFLGRVGSLTGDDIIDQIIAQPQCARFIARKLWCFFVSDDPSNEVIHEVADHLLQNGYDIGATLGMIFKSEAFYSPKVIAHQIKSPVQWLIETTKILEIPLPDAGVIERSLAFLGQVLFAPPNVKGWDGGRAWISASSLLYRYNLAVYLLSGKARILGSGGTKTATISLQTLAPAKTRASADGLLKALDFRIFNTLPSSKERSQYLIYLENYSPPYSDNIIRDLLQIMMSTPEYQLC